MRIALFVTILIAQLFAKINITTFHSHFIQKVTNDQNRTLHYEGEVWFSKKPLSIKWLYTKPNRKEVYIDSSTLIMLEPDLEQATFRRFDKKADLFSLMQHAKKVGPEHYVATYQGKKIDIYTKDGIVTRIVYTDKLDNRNEIVFIDPEQNSTIDAEVFSFVIPKGWDVIRE